MNQLLVQSSLAYFALALTIISAWVKRSPWVWGSFLIFAFLLGYMSKILTPIALLPIGGLFLLHSFLKGDIKGFARFLLVLAATLLSLGLIIHYFPGFNNWKILDKVQISKGASPVTLYLKFDKPFIGIFVLVLGFPLIANRHQFLQLLKVAIPLTLLGLAILIPLALFSGLIHWDPKWPKMTWFFLLENLIFVSIIEEAFWRGFLQKEAFRFFGGKGFFANWACVVVVALGFAALHYFWVPHWPFLTLVFVAGLVYGAIFQITKALEASILCHWVFNATHFLLFTYISTYKVS